MLAEREAKEPSSIPSRARYVHEYPCERHASIFSPVSYRLTRRDTISCHEVATRLREGNSSSGYLAQEIPLLP